MTHHSKRKCDTQPVPRDYAPQLIGHRVHLAWAAVGANWKLLRVEGETAYLETPLTGKPLVAKVADLRFTHRQFDRYEDSLKLRCECQECGVTFKIYHEGQPRDRCRSCRSALRSARIQQEA